MINIFKSVILHRMRGYNLIELFKFIMEDLEMYFQRKLLALANGKSQSLHLALRYFGATGSTIQLSAVQQGTSDSLKFVPSRTNSEVKYEVDCRTGIRMATPVHIKLSWHSNIISIAGINFIQSISLSKIAR